MLVLLVYKLLKLDESLLFLLEMALEMVNILDFILVM
jgi:hypothetical protein